MSKRRFGAAVGAVLITVLALEVVCGAFLVRPQSVVRDPRFGYRPRPGTLIVQSREGWGRYRADSLGFLDGTPLSGDERGRVVLVGDSYANGMQVRYGRRFSEVVEQLLPGVAVRNAAADGRTLLHQAFLVPRLVEAFQPDVVVLQLRAGDFTELGRPETWARAREEFAPSVPPAPPAPSGLQGWLRERAAILSLARGRVSLWWRQQSDRLERRATGRVPDLHDRVAEPVSARERALADSLVGVVAHAHPRIILLYVPVFDAFGTPPGDAYPERGGMLRDLARRHGMVFVDPTPAMVDDFARTGCFPSGFRNTRPARGHLNEQGHAVVGRVLADTLQRHLPVFEGFRRDRSGRPAAAGVGTP